MLSDISIRSGKSVREGHAEPYFPFPSVPSVLIHMGKSMAPVVPYDRPPGMIMPHFQLNGKSCDPALIHLMGVAYPGVLTDFEVIPNLSGQRFLPRFRLENPGLE